MSACSGRNPDIFSISTCTSPCWLGINIGDNDNGNIKRLLENNPYINHDSIQFFEGGPEYYDSFYSFFLFPKFFSLRGGDVEGRIYIKSNKVERILLSGKLNYTVEELFRKFGEPTKIQVYGSGSDMAGIEAFLINEDMGYVIYLPLFTKKSPEIKPSTDIGAIGFLSIGALKSFTNMGNRAKTYTWDGFGNIFDKYPYP